MPSAIAHAAPALALIPLFRAPHVPARLWALGVGCAIAPDLDVLAFRFGVPYEHPLGHRGLWHSLPFAALFSGLVCLATFPRPRAGFSRGRAWLYLGLATASHGLFDALTNGGLGVALWSPIEVSPLSVRAFLSPRGLEILANEALWVWLPCAVWAGACTLARTRGDGVEQGPRTHLINPLPSPGARLRPGLFVAKARRTDGYGCA
ncbi:MAG TPA: metal-dependent hydrolase, partial [Myxococcota bacterium]|nr:metal-dependent hydrolase [Myxococcota bacterium]